MIVFNGKRMLAVLIGGVLAAGIPAGAATFHEWTATPTMGWNSWDFYGTTVTEDQTKAQADYMASNLLAHGWDLVTVDIQWYAPAPEADGNYYNYDTPNSNLVMDAYGRLQPATTRFPSATNGVGFKPLADYVHAKGLRFGIHMMRGIPRYAVDQDLPVYGTAYTAQDIADTNSTCSWNPDMYGVDMSQPGAQAYYNALYDMYASWGVDFVKIDDISRPYDSVQQAEIEAIRAAIDQTGRAMVFSLSPGETPLGKGSHVMQNANQWRISDDFWDNWSALYDQFQRLHDWTPYRGPGYFPDADMLPIGKLHASGGDPDGRTTYFTADEQYTLMSLWSIARSPLIHGGDMTQMDSFTLSLMTNDEVIAVNQSSTHNRQLSNAGGLIAWVADAAGSSNKYLAVFNTGGSSATVPVNLADLGCNGSCSIRSLWDQTDLGSFSGTFSPVVASHGAALYRLSGTFIPTPWITDISIDNGQVNLLWESIVSASSYNVKRSLSENGTYTTIASGLASPAYTDTSVTNGVAYYYAVSAVVGGTESPNSNVRSITPYGTFETISWSYNDWGDAYGTQAADVSGVVPAAFWNDTWLDKRTTDLLGETGAVTPVDISWTSFNTYHITGSHVGPDSDGSYNREILNGYLNAGPAAWGPSITHSAVTLSQIPLNSYNLIVYFSSDVAGREGYVTDGSTTYYFKTLGPASIAPGNALLVQAVDTATNGYAVAANYAVFSDLAGTDQTVKVQMRDNDEWGGIAAIQLVANPGPAFAPTIHSIGLAGGNVTLNWSSDTVGAYQIERKSDLAATNGWTVVTNGLNGGTSNNTNFAVGGGGSEFFRIHGE